MRHGAWSRLRVAFLFGLVLVPRAWPCAPQKPQRTLLGCESAPDVPTRVVVGPTLTDLGAFALGETAAIEVVVAHDSGGVARVSVDGSLVAGSGMSIAPVSLVLAPRQEAVIRGIFAAEVEGPTVMEVTLQGGDGAEAHPTAVFVRAWVEPADCAEGDADCDGVAPGDGDCDDDDPWITPAAVMGDWCDGEDDDCDGEVDPDSPMCT